MPGEREMQKSFADYMKENGWTVELNETPVASFPENITNRYKNIPRDWREFIGGIKSMVSPDETTWFLCAEDFDIQGDKAFQWNEWELIGLESAEGDMEWKNGIKSFWDRHLPIVMSVRGCYSYYAIDLNDGSVVCGAEPEFEECETAASSFTDFTEKIMKKELWL